MAMFDFVKRGRAGRRPNMPQRETVQYPILMRNSMSGRHDRFIFKPTPRNLRFFSHSPYARRAINAIKNPIAMLEWQVVPIKGVDMNSTLEAQIEVATNCLSHPNADDTTQTLLEQVIEDYLISAAACEMQVSGDPLRPLWLYPVDGLSIQLYPGWNGDPNEARFAQVLGYGSIYGGTQVAQLRSDELMYIRPNPSTATPFGKAPLEIAFNTINSLLGATEFAGNVASNSRPSILLDLGEGYSATDLLAFRSYWENEVEGQGRTPIVSTQLPGRSDDKTRRGASVERLYPEGDSGLFLEWQRFLVRTLGVAFDLSPQNFGLEADVNRNTSEVAEDRDWVQAIKPTAKKVQSHLTRDAIQGRLGFSQLCFHFDGLDREDEGAISDIFETEYKNNATTPNEYRAERGKPPLENEWADLCFADMEIAMNAARGAAEVDDSNLSGGGKAKAKKQPPKKGK